MRTEEVAGTAEPGEKTARGGPCQCVVTPDGGGLKV